MANSIEQRAAKAAQIDKMLGTIASTSDSAQIDLLLDWMVAVCQKLQGLVAADLPQSGGTTAASGAPASTPSAPVATPPSRTTPSPVP